MSTVLSFVLITILHLSILLIYKKVKSLEKQEDAFTNEVFIESYGTIT